MKPIEITFKSSKGNEIGKIDTFSSYSFEQNMLSIASAFRFTAPGIDKELRQKIRSGDTVNLYCFDNKNNRIPIATGFIDETDTHVTPGSIEYVITGRDTLGQLVDNDAVNIVNTENATLEYILRSVLSNTRIPQEPIMRQVPDGSFIFQNNPQETKSSTIQRYLELTNCLLWSMPDGRAIIGKPNFKQTPSGKLILRSDSLVNNCLEARIRRNTNQAIRSMVTMIQNGEQINPQGLTVNNDLIDVIERPGVGKNLYRMFSYGGSQESINQITALGNTGGDPFKMGKQLSYREIARENMKVLEVEIVVKGHTNSEGNIYAVDQIYDVLLDDDTVSEPLYVYSCGYELTLEHGMLTRLRLCKRNTMVSGAAQI